MHTKIITYAAVEKRMECKEEKSKLWKKLGTSIGATVVGDRPILDNMALNSAKIKSIVLVVIKLCFFEGISELVS